MSEAMEINQESLEKIGEYVRRHLPEWLPEASEAAAADRALIRDEMSQRFDAAAADRTLIREEMTRRFSDLDRHINRWMTVMAILMTFMTATVAVTNLM